MGYQVRNLTLAMAAILATSGCASAGGSSSQMQSTVYATHRMVQDLSENLSGTLDQLNGTSAELVAKLGATDQQMRDLVSVAQENQYKLEQLQRSLDMLTATLYRHLNLSPPEQVVLPIPRRPLGGTPEPPRGRIEPPRGRIVVEPPVAPVRPDTGVTTTTIPAPILPELAPDTVEEDAHYRQAQQLYAGENYAKALGHFEEHLMMFPNSEHAAKATYWRAHCYFKMGQYSEAISGFDKLRSDYPANSKVPIAMHNGAVAYSRLGQNARAVELFQRLIREHPDDVATEGAREKLRQLQNIN